MTRTISGIHPAGLVIFLIICISALFARRGFCAWICPVGLIGEYFAKLNSKLFKHSPTIPAWLDIPLRAIKYILAFFFIYQIFFKMPGAVIDMFINSPYNRFADVKMLHFFTGLSPVALSVFSALAILTVVFRNFWCRYLCPYGALLGIIGLLCPGRVRRDPARCTGCGKCERSCPGFIKISGQINVNSQECCACLNCVENCPSNGALNFSYFSGKKTISSLTMGLLFLLLFGLGITAARLTGHWKSNISPEQYLSFTAPDSVKKPVPHGTMDRERMRKAILKMRKRNGGLTPSAGHSPASGIHKNKEILQLP